jgi:carbon monoxide dehydrogenase subunit G
MKLEGHFLFEGATTDTVWNALTDPDRIASCLPGCEKLIPTGENSYEMTMSMGIGAIRGKFSGAIRLHDIHPSSDYCMAVSGSGSAGFVNGEGNIQISSVAAGTVVTYTGDVSAGGAIASVGQRMISGAARMIIDRFFKCVSEKLR